MMDKEIDPNEQAFLRIHYWPAIEIFYAAMRKYDKATKDGKRLEDNDPVRVELHRAMEEWKEQLNGLKFVQKMCGDV